VSTVKDNFWGADGAKNVIKKRGQGGPKKTTRSCGSPHGINLVYKRKHKKKNTYNGRLKEEITRNLTTI